MFAVMIAQMADIVVEPTKSAQHVLEVQLSSSHSILLVQREVKTGMLTFCKVFEGCKVGTYWDDSH